MLCWWSRPVRHGENIIFERRIKLEPRPEISLPVSGVPLNSFFLTSILVSVKWESTPPHPSLALKAPNLSDELHEQNLLA